ALSPDARLAACLIQKAPGAFVLMDTWTGEPVRLLTGHRGSVVSASWSKDGRLLAGLDRESGEVRVWEVASGRTRTLRKGPRAWGNLGRVRLAPDGKGLAAVDGRGVWLWDPVSGQPSQVAHGDRCEVAWSPDSRRIALVGNFGRAV